MNEDYSILCESESERINLDEIVKSLFGASKKVLVRMMNSLFSEDFDPELTDVTVENSEFIGGDFGVIRGDLFYRIVKNEKPIHYHVEIQTLYDKTMAIRMFEYGLGKATELEKYDRQEVSVLFYPKQKVIFIEENKSVNDVLEMTIVFPDGQLVNYKVPVMKYWQYDNKKLIEQKLYMLLPLQVFKLRKKLQHLKSKQEETLNCILEVKSIAETVAKEAKDAYDRGELEIDDFQKILLAVDNIFEYLNKRYGENREFEEEVKRMTKTLYDPAVELRGEKKGVDKSIKANKMIKNGSSDEDISRETGLEPMEIQEIRDSLK